MVNVFVGEETLFTGKMNQFPHFFRDLIIQSMRLNIFIQFLGHFFGGHPYFFRGRFLFLGCGASFGFASGCLNFHGGFFNR